MGEGADSGRYRPTTVTCPAGICQKQVAIFDHDRMFGHLLSDHRWSFDTSQSWVVDNMPESEAREEERILLAGGMEEGP